MGAVTMPRKPKDPDNPLSSGGATVTIKLHQRLEDEFMRRVQERGTTRGELGRELLERGLLHLAVETGPMPDDSDDARAQLDYRVTYGLEMLLMVLSEHGAADPAGAVVTARRGARVLAQWADDRALSNRLYLPAADRGEV
jgi:hypothetical protein